MRGTNELQCKEITTRKLFFEMKIDDSEGLTQILPKAMFGRHQLSIAAEKWVERRFGAREKP